MRVVVQFQGERNIGKATSCSLMNDPGQNKSGKLRMHWRLGSGDDASWLMVLEGSSTWFHPNLPSPTFHRLRWEGPKSSRRRLGGTGEAGPGGACSTVQQEQTIY